MSKPDAPTSPQGTQQPSVQPAGGEPVGKPTPASTPLPTGAIDLAADTPAGDNHAKLSALINETAAELRSIATDNGDADTTIRLNALADKIDQNAAALQNPTPE